MEDGDSVGRVLILLSSPALSLSPFFRKSPYYRKASFSSHVQLYMAWPCRKLGYTHTPTFSLPGSRRKSLCLPALVFASGKAQALSGTLGICTATQVLTTGSEAPLSLHNLPFANKPSRIQRISTDFKLWFLKGNLRSNRRTLGPQLLASS